MNQITTGPDRSARILYLFDFDNVAYRHKPACYTRMKQLGGTVIHTHTGLPLKQSTSIAMRSWHRHRDGFLALRDKFGAQAYLAMHLQFDRQAQFDVCGKKDPELPGLIIQLSQYAQVCFVSHTTTESLHMAMERLGYPPAFIRTHAYGLDRLGNDGYARKDNPETDVYKWICDHYGVTPDQVVMIEDTVANLQCARDHRIGRTILVHKDEPVSPIEGVDGIYSTTGRFLQRELDFHAARQRRLYLQDLLQCT